MKQIYPNTVQNKERLTPASEKPVTQEQYEDLVRRTNAAEARADAAYESTNNLRASIANGVTTQTLNATNLTAANGNITNLDSQEVNTAIACANTMLASVLVETPHLNANSASICQITSEQVRSTDVCAENVNTGVATAETVTTDYLQVNCQFNMDCAGIDNADINHGNVTSLTSDSANIRNAFVTCLRGGEANISSADIDQLNALNARVTRLNDNYEIHTYDPQYLTGSTDYYIVLPLFTNGTYVLEGKNDGGDKLFSVETFNSLDNLLVRWSFPTDFRILDFKYKTADNGVLSLQIHVQSFGEQITLYRKSDSTDNIQPPSIYTSDQYLDEKVFNVTEKQGTFVTNTLYAEKIKVDDFDIHDIALPEITVYDKINLTCGLDGMLQCEVTPGEEYQYIANTKDADGLNVRPSWNSPVSCAVNGELRSGTCLVNEKAISEYNGTIASGEAGYVSTTLSYDDIIAHWTYTEPYYYPDDDYYGYNSESGEYIQVAYAWIAPDPEIPDLYHFFFSDGTGTVPIVEEDGVYTFYKYQDTRQTSYPISHLNHCTCVEGSDGTLTSCNVVSQTNTTECECVSCKIILDNTLAIQNNGVTNAKITNSVEVSAQGITCDDFSVVKGLCRYGLGCNDYKDTISCTCLNKMPVTLDTSNVASPSKDIYVECDTETNTLHVTTDACVCGCLNVDCDTIICGNTNIGGELTVGCDAHIAGDLYVEGKTYTKESETISTGSDTVVLRQNSPSSLAANEFAGMIIHNYDGLGDNIMLGTDSTGTARVGTKAGTDSTYAVILYKDGIWYDATETQLDPQPVGELTSYDSKEIIGNFTKYTNAVFTDLDVTGLEALMTRAEETNMVNGALVCWNASCVEAQTLTPPSAGGTVLTYDPTTCANVYKAAGNNGEVLTTCVEVDPVTSCVTKSLAWKCVPTSYHFATMACYLAVCSTIPTDSIVIIDEIENYTISEDIV